MAARNRKKKRGKTVGRVVGKPKAKLRPKKPPRGSQRPPAGYYDPALDAAEAAARRGFGDLRADYVRDFGATGTAGRVGHDFRLGREDLLLGRTRAAEDVAEQRSDLDRGFTRSRSDLHTQHRRGGEDYHRAVAGLTRDYGRLARRQAEGARVAGVLSGGLAEKAAEVRAGNMAWDRAPLDQARARQVEDFQTAGGRLWEDRQEGMADIGRSFGRFGQDTDRALAQLGLGFQRAQQDASTGLGRAGRETEQFGLDTQESRLYQATQAGYVPPSRRRRRRRRGGGGGSGSGAQLGPNMAAGVGSTF